MYDDTNDRRSDQLLNKLSGIGDQNQLQENGIEPIVDLPGVGTNLQGNFLLFMLIYICILMDK